MKKLFTLFIAGLFAAALLAQTPQKMSYQAVVRNTSGELVTGQDIGMKISILQGSPTGSLIYQEIYNPIPHTNANGSGGYCRTDSLQDNPRDKWLCHSGGTASIRNFCYHRH